MITKPNHPPMVHLLTGENMQSRCMVYTIQDKLHIRGTIHGNLNFFYRTSYCKNSFCRIHASLHLLMVDAMAHSLEEVIRILSIHNTIFRPYVICLFNMEYDTGVESKTFFRSVKGFFYKSEPISLLLKGLTQVIAGRTWVGRKILEQCVRKQFEDKLGFVKERTALTTKEIEVLTLLSMGLTNEEIALKVQISIHTIRTHLHNIYNKLGVKTRMEAVLWAAGNL